MTIGHENKECEMNPRERRAGDRGMKVYIRIRLDIRR